MPWCGSSTERGLSSFSGVFYKLRNGLLRSCAGPTCGHGTAGTGLASESLLSQEPHGAPRPVSPLQAVGSQSGGGGLGSRG